MADEMDGDNRDERHRLKTRSVKELLEMEFPPETGEQGYRRGYRDGYAAAFRDISDREGRNSVEAILTWMLEFWDGELWAWYRRADEPVAREDPPQFELPDEARRRGFTVAERKVVYDRARGRCSYCGRLLAGGWHVDHYIPLARGGTNHPENLRAACRDCNLRKGGR